MDNRSPDVLTVGEVAAFMRVSRETVYRMAGRGELPGRKIGRIWRFPRAAIDEYLSERTTARDAEYAALSPTAVRSLETR